MIPKITQTSWWDFGVAPVNLIKDFKTLVKSAAASTMLKYAKVKGQEDLHIIALGAYEGTGFNRNGDCFKEYWCEKNAHYFKDADRAVHRHHKNKPESPKYGNIKAAAYNKEMRRIELIVGLDIDKCADILDEQEKKGITNWSMASKQAYDICTWCGHKAMTDADRCEHIPRDIGEINKQGEMCGMDNPDPNWFEVSYVKRGADRIGLSLQKAAGTSVSTLLPRDYINLFPDFTVPGNQLISKSASSRRKLLEKLSELEKRVMAQAVKLEPVIKAVKTEKIGSEVMDQLRTFDHNRFLKEAATQGIIFSPENFLSYVFGDRIKEASILEVKKNLPGIFSELEKDAALINSDKFDLRPTFFAADEEKALKKIAADYSLFDPFLVNRAVLTKQATVNVHSETTSPAAKELAKQYISYKLAALDLLDTHQKLTDELMFLTVCQNLV